ncbi:hypothetical protein DENSPDRAFT_886381 [Dentipellis sp. KUC8613]|nr:hypothetical protein DENSPDRAFT_886381 [Dentipellis sp. KUC8613]
MRLRATTTCAADRPRVLATPRFGPVPPSLFAASPRLHEAVSSPHTAVARSRVHDTASLASAAPRRPRTSTCCPSAAISHPHMAVSRPCTTVLRPYVAVARPYAAVSRPRGSVPRPRSLPPALAHGHLHSLAATCLAHPLVPQRCRFVARGPAPPSRCCHKRARRCLAPLRGLVCRCQPWLGASRSPSCPPSRRLAPCGITFAPGGLLAPYCARTRLCCHHERRRSPLAPPTALSHGPVSPHHACSCRSCVPHLPPARAFKRTRAPSSAPSRLLACRPPYPALLHHLPPTHAISHARVLSRGPASSHHTHLRLRPRTPFPAPTCAVSRPPVPSHVHPHHLLHPLASSSACSPHLAPAHTISRSRTPSPGLASLLPALTPPFCHHARIVPRSAPIIRRPAPSPPHRAALLTPRAPPCRLHAVSHGAARSQPPFCTSRGPCAILRPAPPSSCCVAPRRALSRHAAPSPATPRRLRPAAPSSRPKGPSRAMRRHLHALPRRTRPVSPSSAPFCHLCGPRAVFQPHGAVLCPMPSSVRPAVPSECPTSPPQHLAAPSVLPSSVSTPHCAVFAPSRAPPRHHPTPPSRAPSPRLRAAPRPLNGLPRHLNAAPRPVVSHSIPPFPCRAECS